MPRALLGAVGVEGADIALLPDLLIQLLFPVEVENMCIQGQGEVSEKILQCAGALHEEREGESAARASTGALEEHMLHVH